MSDAKNLRVIYVASPPMFTKGASAIHIFKMCQAISKTGIETELIISANRSQSEMCEYYNVDKDFRITPFPYFNSSAIRNVFHGLLSAFYIKFFRYNRYDVVVTRNIVFTYIATKLKIPTVYDAHHPLVSGAEFLFNSFKHSDYLVRFSTNSNGLAQMYLKLGLPEEKLVVAHNGVELDPFQDAPSKTNSRKELGLPLRKKIVCYCGNIYEGRGIEALIDAAIKLEDAMFLVVGGAQEDVNRYRRIAHNKGAENFELTGFVPHKDVPKYLMASDILVMPYSSKMTIKGGTKAEEFTSPIKLFEYMASDRPIVATSIPSVLEILENEVNSVLVEPDIAEQIYLGLNKVLNDDDLAKRISKQAKLDVSNYTWEVRAKKLLGLK
ncbi:MAG: glycosyltransferase family 4 protein [Thermodesulfobacteriota bacterium]